MKLRILDVGCGTPSKSHKLLAGEGIVHTDIRRAALHLEGLCDVHHLPFISDSFEIVHASHLLEHLFDPVCAIKEMKRVAARVVIIKVPNGSFFKARESAAEHIFSWNEWTLENLLERFFPKVQVLKSNQWSVFELSLTKLQKIKLMLERTLFGGAQELTAVCSVRD